MKRIFLLLFISLFPLLSVGGSKTTPDLSVDGGPQLEIELNILSFNPQSITALKRNGRKVTLPRNSINTKIMANEFSFYTIPLLIWIEASSGSH